MKFYPQTLIGNIGYIGHGVPPSVFETWEIWAMKFHHVYLKHGEYWPRSSTLNIENMRNMDHEVPPSVFETQEIWAMKYHLHNLKLEKYGP
jgi:hypothetical protein